MLVVGEASFSADIRKGVAAYEQEDYATALNEFKLLAEQGDAFAQFKLGEMYQVGRGVSKDHKKAVRWFRFAAEQGHSGAQLAFGVSYFQGHGVSQSDVLAYMWMEVASLQDASGAKELRDELGLILPEAIVKIAKDLAVACVMRRFVGC